MATELRWWLDTIVSCLLKRQKQVGRGRMIHYDCLFVAPYVSIYKDG